MALYNCFGVWKYSGAAVPQSSLAGTALRLCSAGYSMSLSSALFMTSAQKQIIFSQRKLLKFTVLDVFTVVDVIDCPSSADKFGLWRVVLRVSA